VVHNGRGGTRILQCISDITVYVDRVFDHNDDHKIIVTLRFCASLIKHHTTMTYWGVEMRPQLHVPSILHQEREILMALERVWVDAVGQKQSSSSCRESNPDFPSHISHVYRYKLPQ
jgi:hypothetical protein